MLPHFHFLLNFSLSLLTLLSCSNSNDLLIPEVQSMMKACYLLALLGAHQVLSAPLPVFWKCCSGEPLPTFVDANGKRLERGFIPPEVAYTGYPVGAPVSLNIC
jgi:hypothetical protein